jgi:hypothetical protein
MEATCEEIKEDMQNIESDARKIDCYAILDLNKRLYKMFYRFSQCCFKFEIS